MTDWHVVEGHLSSASWSPGAQVMARPHPQVLLLLQATAETSPLGCHVAVSMEMRRQASRGSDSHLYGQRLGISKETSLPNSTRIQVVMVPAPTPKSFTLSFCCRLSSQCKHDSGHPLPLTVQPSLPWQCYPCGACWEQWWDVILDLQVWAGPGRGYSAKGLPTLSMAHAPLWFFFSFSGGVNVSFPNAASFKILSQ